MYGLMAHGCASERDGFQGPLHQHSQWGEEGFQWLASQVLAHGMQRPIEMESDDHGSLDGEVKRPYTWHLRYELTVRNIAVRHNSLTNAISVARQQCFLSSVCSISSRLAAFQRDTTGVLRLCR